MCMICVDYEKSKLTFNQAVSNLFETKKQLDNDHVISVLEKIVDDSPDVLDDKTTLMLSSIENSI